MIVDTHTHFVVKPVSFTTGIPEEEIDLNNDETFRFSEGIIESQKKYGVIAVWACTLEGLLGQTLPYNKFLSALAQRHNGYILPFCSINPHRGEPAFQEFKGMVSEYKMKGVKFHNWLQAVSCMHEILEKVVDYAGKSGIPVMFHDGTPPYADPLQIGRLAEKYPHTTIVLGHSGLKDLYPDAVKAGRRCNNIYFCACSTPYAGIRMVLDEIGPDRVLFGSDSGFCEPTQIMEQLLDVFENLGLSREEKENVFWRNAKRIIPV